MNKKIALSFGTLLVMSPIATTISCGKELPPVSELSVNFAQGDTAKLQSISSAIMGVTTLSTKSSIDESILCRELSLSQAKENLGYDLTGVDFKGYQASIMAFAPVNNNGIAPAWNDTTNNNYKFYNIYVNVKNSNGEVVFRNRFAYVLIVTGDADVIAMFNEAKRVEDQFATPSTKTVAEGFGASTSQSELAAFNTTMGTSIALGEGFSGMFYTEQNPYYIPGTGSANNKAYRVRFYLRKGNKEFFNFNSLEGEVVTVKEEGYVAMSEAEGRTWFTGFDRTSWTNLVNVESNSGAYEFLNPRKLAFAAEAEISKVEFGQMVKNYSYLVATEREILTKAQFNLTTKIFAKNAITADATSATVTIKYYNDGTEIENASHDVTVTRKA